MDKVVISLPSFHSCAVENLLHLLKCYLRTRRFFSADHLLCLLWRIGETGNLHYCDHCEKWQSAQVLQVDAFGRRLLFGFSIISTVCCYRGIELFVKRLPFSKFKWREKVWIFLKILKETIFSWNKSIKPINLLKFLN